MQGLFIDGVRPKSKKAVGEALADDPSRVTVEATSWHGDEYGGPLTSWPDTGAAIHFVGPDPHTKRNFYGSIVYVNGVLKVSKS